MTTEELSVYTLEEGNEEGSVEDAGDTVLVDTEDDTEVDDDDVQTEGGVVLLINAQTVIPVEDAADHRRDVVSR